MKPLREAKDTREEWSRTFVGLGRIPSCPDEYYMQALDVIYRGKVVAHVPFGRDDRTLESAKRIARKILRGMGADV